MSLHHDLRSIDDELRGLMNRRDRLRKECNKHHNRVQKNTSRIKKADVALEALRNKTAEDTAMWTDAILLSEDYIIKSKKLLAIAEKEVDVRLDELAAL